jgi:hypothetical protein
VWFLAGTYGTRRTVRRCTVPRGKYLFFPLINSIFYPSDADSNPDCRSMMQSVKLGTDDASALVLNLNGVGARGLEAHRQATTQCFDLGARAEPPLHVFPTAGNGYYAMFKPLPPGTYELNFGGVLSTHVQAVTYTLIIE